MPKNQPNLPPMEVAKQTQPASARANYTEQMSSSSPRVNETQDEPLRPKSTPDLAAIHAAELFDEALTIAKLSTAEVSYLLGISESLVRRMRSRDARERISFVQMLRLPPAFHLALNRVMNAKYGYGAAALRDLLDAVGRLAVNL